MQKPRLFDLVFEGTAQILSDFFNFKLDRDLRRLNDAEVRAHAAEERLKKARQMEPWQRLRDGETVPLH